MSWISVTSAVVLLYGAMAAAQPAPPVRAVSVGEGGRLVYAAGARGDRVPDYSFAGYAGGGVEIPEAPVRVVVEPVDGDDGARIQAAIDYVGTLAARDDGIRGAVLLGRGTFEVAGTIKVRSSGVVLRGSGYAQIGTVIVGTGQSRRTLIQVAGVEDRHVGSAVEVADEYVPVGTRKFNVAAGHGFKVGDRVVVKRPCTAEWIRVMGMDRMGGDRHGGGWRVGSREVEWERTVTAVEGDAIEVDVPLTASLDRKFGGGSVAKLEWPGRIRQVGVENMRCESAFDAAKPMDEDHSWIAVAMSGVEDGWVRRVEAKHFVGGAVALWDSVGRVTVEDCKSLAPVSEDAGQRRHAFFTAGQQTLFQRCYSEAGRHDFAVGFCAAGPNAFVQCESEGSLGDSGPIDSWATGVLYDNVRIDGGELNLHNRWYRGQQAGWAGANSFLWQCSAAVINCYNPPAATNWAYGCWGQFSGDGEFAASRESVRPESLYYAQLAERLGKDVRTEMLERGGESSTSPTIQQAADMTAAARRPMGRLEDWIDEVVAKRPISISSAGAKRFEDLEQRRTPNIEHRTPNVEVKNGWLTSNGEVVVGSQRGITWWAGGVRPDDVEAARKREPNVTRFVPGRIGAGLTDDLDELTTELKADGYAALRHHYGLWYDVRDADHERVRRQDGDVWPPFYEMPFMRSGTGRAWDGLSKYDLTKYNPWYWDRLREFAELGNRKGVMLIAEHYFQHNILEAGAHWASSPWRPVNNVNGTGFPEPPPYAGDKRIFLAEQFYDVTNSARRPLHRAFIRKHLENFAEGSGVIHMTSAEFTGPLEFTRFWVDTIGEWEKETGKKPLVGLSTTKDVQDAILSDDKRAAFVSVIDINYWWYQQDGKPYEPKGGQNLAPRQHERLLKPRPSSFESIVRAVREYREKYPEKAVIYSARGSDNGWAALMGGASMASIRTPLPAGLAKALAGMRPMDLPSKPAGQWALGDAGKGYLVYANAGGTIRVDLSGASEQFVARWIDPRSGQVKSEAERVEAGKVVEFQSGAADGPVVLWLARGAEGAVK